MNIRGSKLDKEDNIIPGLICVKDKLTGDIRRIQREEAFDLVSKDSRYCLTTKRGWRRQDKK